MKNLLAVCLLALAASMAWAAPEEGKKSDRDAVQGTWNIESMERDGQKNDGDEIKKGRIIIKGDEFTFEAPDGNTIKGTLKFDSTKSPKAMDVTTHDGAEIKGIYSVEKDIFKVCFNRSGGDRPTKLETKADDNCDLIVFKKAK